MVSTIADVIQRPYSVISHTERTMFTEKHGGREEVDKIYSAWTEANKNSKFQEYRRIKP